MEENYEDKPVFEVEEDDRVVFNKLYRRFETHKPHTPTIFGDTKILTELGKIFLKPFSKKLDGRIRIYLGTIAKEKSSIYIDKKAPEDIPPFLEQILDDAIIKQINASLIHELIHREGKIYHGGPKKADEDIKNAERIMDYYNFVNLNRKEIATYGLVLPKNPESSEKKAGTEGYLFACLQEKDPILKRYGPAVYNEEINYLDKALQKYRLSDYYSDFSDADSASVLDRKNLLGLACDSYMGGTKKKKALNVIIDEIPWADKTTRSQSEFYNFIMKAVKPGYRR